MDETTKPTEMGKDFAAAVLQSLSPEKKDEILMLLLSAVTNETQQKALLGQVGKSTDTEEIGSKEDDHTLSGGIPSSATEWSDMGKKETTTNPGRDSSIGKLFGYGEGTQEDTNSTEADSSDHDEVTIGSAPITDHISSEGGSRLNEDVEAAVINLGELQNERCEEEEIYVAPFTEDEEIHVEPFQDEEILTGPLILQQNIPICNSRAQPQHDNLQMSQSPVSALEPCTNDLAGFQKHFSMRMHEEHWHSPYSESVYTLIYMCDFNSQGFWYGCFVYALQITVIALTLFNVIDDLGSENPLQIPAMVDTTVTIAQGVGLFLVLAFQQDLLEAVMKLQDGFFPEVQDKHPGATYATWLFACWAQLVEGLMLLGATFVLMFQVDNVIEIMLNFAALEFIGEIDDLGFFLCKLGFVTDELQRQAIEIVDFKIPKRAHRNTHRKVLYYMTLTVVFVTFGLIKKWQLDGHYLQSYVYVQFGDFYDPILPYYSGLLYSGNGRTSGHREYRDHTQNILLSYCHREESWTFSSKNNSCLYFAKSDRRKTYDVTTIPDSAWEILDKNSRPKPFDFFHLVGRDCDAETCGGECIHGLCHCPNNLFGMDCEFGDICPELVLHGGSQPFPPAAEGFAISDQFQILTNGASGEYAKVNNMPVYYSNQTYPGNIIFFGGRRWVLTSELDLFDDIDLREANLSQKFFPERTAELLHQNYHGHHQAKHIPSFLSDPVDFATPAFQPTPIDVSWFTVKVLNETARLYTPDIPIGALLTCADCRAEHGGSCDNAGGTCNQTTGVCECYSGYAGTKCEQEDACYDMDEPCFGDGVCDLGTGECRCNLPWYGKTCDYLYYCFEEGGQCKNGGVCNHTSSMCDCTDDFFGAACEKRKDCNVFGCENGGQCNKTSGMCDCNDPYKGVLCSLIDETKAVPCPNDKTIFNMLLCPGFFNCTISGCKNGGVCLKETGICECQEPYVGADCSQVPDCSVGEDCIGGGLCLSGTCDCTDPLATGKLCENTSYSGCSTLDGCFNAGICQPNGLCECKPPYSGARCQYIVD